jgi:hypothetical protein
MFYCVLRIYQARLAFHAFPDVTVMWRKCRLCKSLNLSVRGYNHHRHHRSLRFVFLTKYNSVDRSRMVRVAGYLSCVEEKRIAYRILVEKPEWKSAAGKHGRKWEDDVRMHLTDIRCEHMDWIYLSLDVDNWWALLNTLVKFLVHIMWGKFLSSCWTVSFPRRAAA